MHISRTFIAACALAGFSMPVAAQLPSASAAAFGMGGNYVAEARGFNAMAWNPANLGLPGGPAFSINAITINGNTGLDPVKLNDVTAFGGQRIPNATKEAWLTAIGSGRERGTVDGGVSLVALSFGRIGLQVGASGTGEANLNQDAVEALLYGNAGRTGTAKDLSLAGSSASGSSFVTGAASVAFPLPFKPSGRAGEQFSFGVTGKYVVGAAMGRAQDNGSTVTSSNIAVSFPAIFTHPDSISGEGSGSGMGLDLGLAWSDGSTTIGATVRNVVNTFAWDTKSLVSSPGIVKFNGTVNDTEFETAPYSSAPAAMRAALEAEKFKPEFAAGISRRLNKVTITADASTRLADGIDIGPNMHVGVGAELRFLPFLPIRGGVAAISEGYQVAGGAGLRLGPVEIGAGGSMRSRNSGTDYGFVISVLSIR